MASSMASHVTSITSTSTVVFTINHTTITITTTTTFTPTSLRHLDETLHVPRDLLTGDPQQIQPLIPAYWLFRFASECPIDRYGRRGAISEQGSVSTVQPLMLTGSLMSRRRAREDRLRN